MQWHGSTNKSPTILNAVKIKFDTGIYLRSPLPKIHYYQSQAVTSIRNLTKPFGLSRNINLQLNPYPNTQLDLYCNNNLFVQCTNPSP